MTGLIERLWNRAFRLATRDFNGDGAKLVTEAADALEALRGYARHKLGCEMLDPERPFWTCTCGLDDLLAKLGGE